MLGQEQIQKGQGSKYRGGSLKQGLGAQPSDAIRCYILKTPKSYVMQDFESNFLTKSVYRWSRGCGANRRYTIAWYIWRALSLVIWEETGIGGHLVW